MPFLGSIWDFVLFPTITFSLSVSHNRPSISPTHVHFHPIILSFHLFFLSFFSRVLLTLLRSLFTFCSPVFSFSLSLSLSLSSSHSAFPFILSFSPFTVGHSSLWAHKKKKKKTKKKEANFHLIRSLITISHRRTHHSHNFKPFDLVLRWKPVFVMCSDDGNNDESPFISPWIGLAHIFFRQTDFLWKSKRKWLLNQSYGASHWLLLREEWCPQKAAIGGQCRPYCRWKLLNYSQISCERIYLTLRCHVHSDSLCIHLFKLKVPLDEVKQTLTLDHPPLLIRP